MAERHYPTDEGRCFECGKPWLNYPTCEGGAEVVAAKNERLRASIVRILNGGYPDEAWDRAYEEAEKHGIDFYLAGPA